MAETKYGKYLLSGPRPWNPAGTGPVIAYLNDEIYRGSHQYYVHWVPVTPQGPSGMTSWDQMGHGPHKHKSPEAVIHIGTNPDDPLDLGAEVEMFMGPELEKRTITTSTLVYLPAEFIHGPWIIKRVDRPFVMVTVGQEPTHTEKSLQELVSEEEREKLLFIDQGYDSDERILTLPPAMRREW